MTRLTQADLDALVLKHGAHDPDSTYCVMEAHAAMVGDKWTDSPADVSPVIAAFMRSWNDALPDDPTRTRLLVPILREGIMRDTAGSAALEQRRAWMAFDWLVREHTATWMELTPSLVSHAQALRGLPTLSPESMPLAMPTLSAAWAAARAAARAAAGAAARAAEWAAAWAAARAAAGAAARAAEWDAAWAAEWDAARDAFAPTVTKLQASAQDLVRRMCAEKEKP